MDAHWIYVKTYPDLLDIIAEGKVNKGMPAWEDLLKPDELVNVSAYVVSIIGNSVSNPKDPQGEEVQFK